MPKNITMSSKTTSNAIWGRNPTQKGTKTHFLSSSKKTSKCPKKTFASENTYDIKVVIDEFSNSNITYKKLSKNIILIKFIGLLKFLFPVIGKPYDNKLPSRISYGRNIIFKHGNKILSCLNFTGCGMYVIEIKYHDLNVISGDLFVTISFNEEISEEYKCDCNYDNIIFEILSHYNYKKFQIGIIQNCDSVDVNSEIIKQSLELTLDHIKRKTFETQIKSNKSIKLDIIGYIYIDELYDDCVINFIYNTKHSDTKKTFNMDRKLHICNKDVNGIYFNLNDICKELTDDEKKFILKKIISICTIPKLSIYNTILDGNNLLLVGSDLKNQHIFKNLNDIFIRCQCCFEIVYNNYKFMEKKTKYNNLCCRKLMCITCINTHIKTQLEIVVNDPETEISYPFRIKCPCDKMDLCQLSKKHFTLPIYIATVPNFKEQSIEYLKIINKFKKKIEEQQQTKTREEAEELLASINENSTLGYDENINICPNDKCNNIILKSRGCSAVICSYCRTKLCIHCGSKLEKGKGCSCGKTAYGYAEENLNVYIDVDLENKFDNTNDPMHLAKYGLINWKLD